MLTLEEDSNIFKKTAMLLLGAVTGLIYVIFLPFVFIVLLVGKTLEKLWDLAMDTVYFGWRPSETYLSGKKKKGKEKNSS